MYVGTIITSPMYVVIVCGLTKSLSDTRSPANPRVMETADPNFGVWNHISVQFQVNIVELIDLGKSRSGGRCLVAVTIG